MTASDTAADRRELMARLLRERGIEIPSAPAESEQLPADPLALSPTEERMWMLHELDPAAATGTAAGAVWLRGPVDEYEILRALRLVGAEFPALRTRYREDPDRGVVPDPTPWDEWLPDFAAETAASASDALDAARALARRPFDLEADHGVRIRLVRVVSETDLVLLAVAGHHISLDDAAWPVVLQRVCAIVRDGVTEPAAEDPSYRAYAQRRAAESGSPAERAHLEFWRGAYPSPPRPVALPSAWFRRQQAALAPAAVIDVAGGATAPRDATTAGRLRLEIPGGGRIVRDAARRLGVSPFHLEVAATAMLLSAAGGDDDMTLATPVVDASSADGRPLVGATGNLVPLRIRLDSERTVAEELRRVKQTCLDAVAHSEVPIESILGALGSSGRRPFNVTVLLHQGLEDSIDLPGVRALPAPLPPVGAETDLTIAMERPDEDLRLEITYAPAVRTASAADVLDRLVEIIEALTREANADAAWREAIGAHSPAAEVVRGDESLAPDRGAGRTASAARVAEVLDAFRAALPDAEIDADTDFFDAGGHSLIATRVIVDLRRRTGADLRIADFFAAPSARLLAARLPEKTPPAAVNAVPASEAALPAEVPLSPAQSRLWFLEKATDAGRAYLVPMLLDLDGAPDERALVGALHDLVRRHDVLRSVIGDSDGTPRSRYLPDDELAEALPRMVRVVTVADDHAAETLLRDEIEAPFDRALPLFRALIVDTNSGPRHLALVLHHLICDEWSTGVLLRDLSRAYARRTGAPTDPAPVAASYARHALARAASAGDDAHVEWWAQELSGAPQDLLVRGRTRDQAARTSAGGSVPVALAPHVVHAVHAFSRAEGTSPFVVLQTALALTLDRLGAGSDVLIATPVSGREDAAFSDTVGLFVNTVVLRHRLAGDPSGRDVVADAHASMLAALEHSSAEFDAVVDRVADERTTTRNPLAQVLVQIHDDHELAGEIGGEGDAPFSYRARRTAQDTAKFDLTLELSVTPTRIDGEIGFARDVYDAEDAEAVATTFTRIVKAITSSPSSTISRLAVPEEATVLDGGAAAPMDTVPELLESAPLGGAITIDGARIDREEFARRVDALRRRLGGALASGRGQIAAVLVARDADSLIALVAAAASGLAVAPLDATAPDAHLRQRIDTLSPDLLLADSDRAARLVTDAPVLALDGSGDEKDPLRSEASGAHAAYVVHTSGSTGAPRAVAGTQRALANRLRWDLDQGADIERVLLLSSLTFIDGVTSVLAAAAGRELIVPTNEELADLALLEQLAVRTGTQSATTVPSLLAVILRERPALVRSVRRWVSSGEALAPSVVATFAAVAPDSVLIDSYGQTEGAGDDVRGVRAGAGVTDTGAIGSAVPGVTVRVLDHRLMPVPDGATGDVYTSGVQLAAGYLGAPGATAERFVAAPGGARMYRTGDRGRIRPASGLELGTRSDREVKVRGVRIDPASAAHELAGIPEIVDAAVLAEPSPSGARLAAAVVPADPDSAPEQLLAAARRDLPNHLVPSRIAVVTEIPRLSTGKVDVRALRLPLAAGDSGGAPRGEEETEIARIFRDVLGASLGAREIGRDDDFFALGGDSITSLAVVSRARASGLEVTVPQIFEHPTVAALASVAMPTTAQSAPSDTAPLAASGLDDDELAGLLARVEGAA